jgi:hypothetical protein
LNFRGVYDKQQQDKKIEAIAAKHLQSFLKNWSIYWTQLRDDSVEPAENIRRHKEFVFEPLGNMYMDFIEFGSFIKHPGFLEENEWRFAFISENAGDCSFRESRFGLTPYLPICLDLRKSPSSLKRIVVGPDTHKNEWLQTIRLLLAKVGVSGVEVVPSEIPYR